MKLQSIFYFINDPSFIELHAQGFNLDIHDLMKDSLDKKDKSKTVDIFQVMAEAIHKEDEHSKYTQSCYTSKYYNFLTAMYHFEWISFSEQK